MWHRYVQGKCPSILHNLGTQIGTYPQNILSRLIALFSDEDALLLLIHLVVHPWLIFIVTAL